MTAQQPTVEVTPFPTRVLLESPGDLVPRRVYARVELPAGGADAYDSLLLFVRVRALRGIQAEMFTEQTKGDIHRPQYDDPSANYCMELVESFSPLKGGRPIPGPGWFEIFDLENAGVREPVEVEAIVLRKHGRRRWCSEKRLIVRPCPRPARLRRRFPIQDAGGQVAIGDLDHDGELDFLVTAGAMRQTAYRHDGEVLWDCHAPEARILNTHNTLVPIADLDGDGRSETVGIRREGNDFFVCVLDGRHGTVKRKTPHPACIMAYDDPPMCNIQAADLRGLGQPRDLIVSHHYSDITAFDDRLNVLWRQDLWADEGRTAQCRPPRAGAEARFPYGFGHTPACGDVDGDGRDEVVVGATLLDHDGRFLWNRKDLPRVNADHNDSVHIADLERNGQVRILLSTGLHCLATDGAVVWSFGRTVCHGQHVRAFPAIPGAGRLQILLIDWRCYVGLEPPHTVYLLDGDGTVLWHKISGWAVPVSWSAAICQDLCVKSDEMAGMGEIVDWRGQFQGYVPMGNHNRARRLSAGHSSETWILTAQREGQAYLELYECAVPPAAAPPREYPEMFHDDDHRYALY
ncbi:MAG: FG-GAP repeat protein [Verrucomicrobia bacterium]|nr:FG-GAP repeat protein [Verrucomicrobiota bacterium]